MLQLKSQQCWTFIRAKFGCYFFVLPGKNYNWNNQFIINCQSNFLCKLILMQRDFRSRFSFLVKMLGLDSRLDCMYIICNNILIKTQLKRTSLMISIFQRPRINAGEGILKHLPVGSTKGFRFHSNRWLYGTCHFSRLPREKERGT